MKTCKSCVYYVEGNDFCYRNSFTYNLIRRLSLSGPKTVCQDFKLNIAYEFIKAEEMTI